MGTRGLVGFVINGTEKLAYNHWDSYPSGLGLQTLAWLREQDLGALAEQVERLELIDEEKEPTPEQVRRAKEAGVIDITVSERSTSDWYCLLRGAQGDLTKTLEVGMMKGDADFAIDSLFCEWAYVINLDDGLLEAYEGFQKAPHANGRFADRGPSQGVVHEYHPVALRGSWPLHDLPSDEAFLATLEGAA